VPRLRRSKVGRGFIPGTNVHKVIVGFKPLRYAFPIFRRKAMIASEYLNVPQGPMIELHFAGDKSPAYLETPAATLFAGFTRGYGARSFDGPNYRFSFVDRLLVFLLGHGIRDNAPARLNEPLIALHQHAANRNAGIEIS
jgi:hypothetical protein